MIIVSKLQLQPPATLVSELKENPDSSIKVSPGLKEYTIDSSTYLTPSEPNVPVTIS